MDYVSSPSLPFPFNSTQPNPTQLQSELKPFQPNPLNIIMQSLFGYWELVHD